MPGDELEQLEVYLSGELVGDMGLRCPLGSFLEYRARVGGEPSTEMSGKALHAASLTDRIERTLKLIDVEHRAVLAALYDPRASGAPAAVKRFGGVGRVMDVVSSPESVRDLLAKSQATGAARAAAKSELRKMHAHAKVAIFKAEQAYLAAVPIARTQWREQRRAKLRRSLEGS